MKQLHNKKISRREHYLSLLTAKCSKAERTSRPKPCERLEPTPPTPPPQCPTLPLAQYLQAHYRLRVNLLTEQPEIMLRSDEGFLPITTRLRNTLLTELREAGLECNATQLMEYCYSNYVEAVHPFRDFMRCLPQWDGHDRVLALAMRVGQDATWLMVFRRWMRMMAAQWMGAPMQAANMMVPILISQRQGMRKSTFCRLIMPRALQDYYMDKLDFTQKANYELKMAQFGLINLDEFDRYGPRLMPLFKNVTQMQSLVVRRTYASTFTNLPRIASFIATSNSARLLSDATGSRRFYCQEVHAPIDCTLPDYTQLYAQLRHEINEGQPLYFSKSEEALIEAHNSDYYAMTTLEQAILRCYRLADDDEPCTPLLARTIRDTVQRRFPKMVAGRTLRHFSDELSRIAPSTGRSAQGNLYPLIQI